MRRINATGSPQLSFLELDPPDHTRLRRFAMPTFSPKAVAGFGPQITATVGELLDAVPADGSFDLVGGYAAPMPIAVITRLLGIPDADSEEFERYGQAFGSALGGLQSLRHARELFEAQRRLQRIFTDLIEARRVDPGDDVISRLATAPGEQIRADDMVPLCTLLLIAGFETTVNLIGNTVLALLAAPGAVAPGRRRSRPWSMRPWRRRCGSTHRCSAPPGSRTPMSRSADSWSRRGRWS